MSRGTPTAENLQFLRESLDAEIIVVNIRLRPGEHQFELAKGIAAFELQLSFPNVKDLIRRLYGEAKTQDIRFIRKIQTILKKMEKSNVVKILPKEKSWYLQRYALSSFKFQDVEENAVILATEAEKRRTLDLINSQSSSLNRVSVPRPDYSTAAIGMLISIMIISYGAILWTLIQPTLNTMVFAPAFVIAILCSILLGIAISRRQ